MPRKVLFVCSRNIWRSLTAERIFASDPELEVRSAGTSLTARHRISQKDVVWADIIICMEKKHKEMIEKSFPAPLPRREVLNIPDEYKYMDPELIDLLHELVPRVLG